MPSGLIRTMLRSGSPKIRPRESRFGLPSPARGVGADWLGMSLILERNIRLNRPQPGQVQIYGFTDLLLGFLDRRASGDAPWKIRHVRRKVVPSLLDNNGVPHASSLIETSLLQNTAERSRSKIVAGLPCATDSAQLGRMLELAMASPRCPRYQPSSRSSRKISRDLHLTSISRYMEGPRRP